jgi:hypothetical protein
MFQTILVLGSHSSKLGIPMTEMIGGMAQMHVFIVVIAFTGLMAIFWVNYRLQRTRFPRRGQSRGKTGSGEADDPHRASRTFLECTWP